MSNAFERAWYSSSNIVKNSFACVGERGQDVRYLTRRTFTSLTYSLRIKKNSSLLCMLQNLMTKVVIIYLIICMVVSCRLQIHSCILACVMSREFTRKAVMNFLPAQFPWIWCKCLRSNFVHSKILNLTKYREVLVKYSLLITHAGMPIWIWH